MVGIEYILSLKEEALLDKEVRDSSISKRTPWSGRYFTSYITVVTRLVPLLNPTFFVDM